LNALVVIVKRDMGKLRYIGSKARLVNKIIHNLGKPNGRARFFDVFSGTGVVSRAALDLGWEVIANDHLKSASVMTAARLLTQTEVSFRKLGGYSGAVGHLNMIPPREGYFFQEYAPSGRNQAGVRRLYFSNDNAGKIDGIRSEIVRLKELSAITPLEHTLLLGDLMEAVNQVANIAGTYGCFLRELTPAALRNLRLTCRSLPHKKHRWKVTTRDALDVKTKFDDVAYLDPPYTKRQYAAYYHILETIACEDEPIVAGITGLRPWKAKASSFCYKTKAAAALDQLINQLVANRILISYSSDGHIAPERLRSIIQKYGTIKVHEYSGFGRYSPNKISRSNSNNMNLCEYVFDLRKS